MDEKEVKRLMQEALNKRADITFKDGAKVNARVNYVGEEFRSDRWFAIIDYGIQRCPYLDEITSVVITDSG